MPTYESEQTVLNPPGASYDYTANGVTLDRGSVARSQLDGLTRHLEGKKPLPEPKAPERLSCWERLISHDWMEQFQ